MRSPARLALAFLALVLVANPGCRRQDRAAPPPAGVFRFSPRPNRAAEIRWRVWSQAAFDEARASRRPVLLSLAAVWCHWCHVLDETTLSDARVIERLNGAF